MSFHGLTGHETLSRLVGKRRNLTFSRETSSSSVFDVTPKNETWSNTLSGVEVKTQSHVRSVTKNQDEVVKLHGAGDNEGGKLVAHNAFEQVGNSSTEQVEQKHSSHWVKCPVCSKSIRTDVINTHIDVCLQGETTDRCKKRKQLTLSQFGDSTWSCKHPTARPGAQRGIATEESQRKNECLTPEDASVSEHSSPPVDAIGKSPMHEMTKDVKVQISGEEDVRHCLTMNAKCGMVATKEEVGLHRRCCIRLQSDSVSAQPEKFPSDTAKLIRSKESTLPQRLAHCVCECHISTVKAESRSAPEVQVHSKGECDPGIGYAASEKTLLPSRESDTSERHGHICREPGRDPLQEVLHTSIVGRKFNRRTSCKLGMKITVLREADNAKDPNAIKVVQMENPMSLKLGHLSRDISFHLSSLLDRGYLKVWGTVTALPDQTFGPVPIKLFCETVMEREAFLKLDGAEDSLQKAIIASKTFDTPHRSPGSGSKYQQNFLFMLRTVLERDSHLLMDEEINFLETFRTLSDESQRLFIRLYQRKGPWFRLSALDYTDVPDIVKASTELRDTGYMSAEDNSDEAPEVILTKKFEILNVMELRQLLCVTTMKKKSEAASFRKDDLIKMAVAVGVQKRWNLIPGSPTESCPNIIQSLAEISGPCVRVSDRADFLLWRAKRLFFLNGETDLSSFLVVDMGLVKYPRYKCWRERKIFETREALLAYEEALEVAQRMDVALDSNDSEAALKFLAKARQEMTITDGSCQMPPDATPTFLGRFSASYVYRQVCTLGISILERERRYLEAIDVLRELLSKKTLKSGRWGHWTVRLSVNLDHLGRKEESLQVAEMGASDPWIRGGDRVALQRRVARLGKPPRRWKIPSYVGALKKTCKEVHIQGRPLNSELGVKSWFYGYDGQQCRVEELALQHYASEVGGGWRGLHCEGGVWMTFFGILMWDVLFADVPDVFQNTFQTAPLDLGTEVFFSSRQRLIEEKLADIVIKDVSSLLALTWNQNFGTSCRGVNWERYSLEQLQEIAQCIGGPGLSAICRLLAEDYAGWTAGMPDLLLWRISETSNSKHLTESGPQLTGWCSACGCMSTTGFCDGSRSTGLTGIEPPFTPVNGQQRRDTTADVKLHRSIDEVHQIPAKCNIRGKAKLVEVKGPRDRLSEQQRAWIWILMNAGLDVEVCKVVETALE